MATGSPSEVAALVVATATARPALTGGGRSVCIDGPAGSGKTTLAAEVARLTAATVVHMDDLMQGWAGATDTEDELAGLLRPWARGRPGRHRHYDWAAGRFVRTVEVTPAPWLVVEGVGSGRAALAVETTLTVWVEVDDDLRLARGLIRDGAEMESRWRGFMTAEAELFARERTRARADVLVDGTGRVAPVVR